MKKIYRDQRRSTGQQPQTKKALRPAVQPRIQVQRNSNAGFVPPPVYIAFRSFVPLKKRSSQVCLMPNISRACRYRAARRNGEAGQDRAERDADKSVRLGDNCPLFPPWVLGSTGPRFGVNKNLFVRASVNARPRHSTYRRRAGPASGEP